MTRSGSSPRRAKVVMMQATTRPKLKRWINNIICRIENVNRVVRLVRISNATGQPTMANAAEADVALEY